MMKNLAMKNLMKNRLCARILLLLLLVPAMLQVQVQADVMSDMRNENLSLVQVMSKATRSGMSVAEAVSAMLKADKSRANAIVATAMLSAPEQYAAIVRAAIDAGVPAGQVVVAALVATDGDNSAGIAAAALAAAPDQRAAISSATRVLGLTVVAATPVQVSARRAGGGGAGVTAEDVIGLQTTIARIESDLVAAGFSAADVSRAVAEITMALQNSRQTAARVTATLGELQTRLSDPNNPPDADTIRRVIADTLASVAQI